MKQLGSQTSYIEAAERYIKKARGRYYDGDSMGALASCFISLSCMAVVWTKEMMFEKQMYHDGESDIEPDLIVDK